MRAITLSKVLSLAALVGCAAEPSVDRANHDIVIAGGESGHLAFVDARQGRLAGRSNATFQRQLAWTLWGTRDTALINYAAEDGRYMAAIDLQTGTPLWRERLANAFDRIDHDGIEPWGGQSLTVLPDGNTLVLATAFRDGVRGIARMDLGTRRVNAFLGPLFIPAAPVIPLAHSPFGPNRFIMLGSRSNRLDSGTMLFVVDPDMFTIVDSIPFAAPFDAPYQLVADPSGQGAFLSKRGTVFYLGFASRQVERWTPAPIGTSTVVSPSGSFVAILDHGTWPDDPGSGEVRIVNADLVHHTTVQLGPAREGGAAPLVAQSGAFIQGGTRLLIMSGTASIGPLYGVQQSRAVVIDPFTGEILHRIGLDDWNAGAILPRPEHADAR